MDHEELNKQNVVIKIENNTSINEESNNMLNSDNNMYEDRKPVQTNNANNYESSDSKLELNKKVECGDDEGEDLPDNFFDDFSNNDFMAGLDIVDDWVDEDNTETRTDSSSLSQKKDTDTEKRRYSRSPGAGAGKYKEKDYRAKVSREMRSKEDEKCRYLGRSRDFRSRSRDYNRRRKSRDRELDRRSPLRKRSKDRYRSQERHKLREQPLEKSTGTQKSTTDQAGSGKASEDIDTRRDPEKTKRDIQRDKIRCAKDFEARVLQEQLKVAESGLFPPGTELDVVLELEKKKAEALVKEVEETAKESNVDVVATKKQEKHKLVEARPRKVSRSPRRLKERPRSPRRSRSLRRSRSPRRSRSLKRSRSPRRSRSPEYRPRKRIFTRLDRSRDRSYSPRRHHRRLRSLERRKSRSVSPKRRSRSLNREELLRRNDDLRLQIRAKRRERYIKDLSPVSESRFSRSRSPSNLNLSSISKMSDRELWLRNRDRYKQRYGRSISPVSFSSVDGEGVSPKCKRSKKNSFIKEIERIAAIDKNMSSPLGSIPEIAHPVPAPNQVHPNLHFSTGNQPFMNPMQPEMQMYQPMMDFTHGGMMNTAQPPGIVGVPSSMPGMGSMLDMNMLMTMPGPGVAAQHPIDLQTSQLQHNQNTVQLQQHAVQLQQQFKHQNRNQTSQTSGNKPPTAPANKEVTKLFEEQKISLSDYLSVSAKPIDPATPINLHKKIKVISKCQEVIRILSDESRFSGRFIPKLLPPGSERQQESNTLKWKSPLRKVFPLRFMFTTPSKKTATQESVKTLLNKLLLVCDIPLISDSKPPTKLCVNPADTAPIVSANVSKVSSNCSSSSNYTNTDGIPLVHHNTQPIPKPVPPPISFTIKESKPKGPISKSEGVQTDPVKCQICEIRSATKYTDSGTQTSERRMEDESTQVTQEDLTKSSVIFAPRGILKNSGSVQSLSHLTPAQLLALKQEDSNEWSNKLRHDSHDTFPTLSNSLVSNVGGSGRSLSLSATGTSSGSSSFNPGFGMNYDKIPYSNMLPNSRGMGMGMGNVNTNDLTIMNRPNNMYESRNMMNEPGLMNDARNNMMNDNRNMMMNQRQDFNESNFRNSGNIFGGQMPNRGGGNSHNRNIFRSIWK